MIKNFDFNLEDQIIGLFPPNGLNLKKIKPHKIIRDCPTIEYQNTKLDFSVTREKIGSTLFFIFTLRNMDTEILLKIKLKNNEPVMTYIQKKGPRENIPKEAGIKLYEKLPEFFRTLVKKTGRQWTHQIMASPEISMNPISREKWYKIFGPFLKKNNYTQVPFSEDEWIKKYK